MKTMYDFEGQERVISPQLIYYPQLIQKNIDHMIELAGGAERLWPHIKTHKMEEVVKMQVAAGITRCKAATIAEVEMAANAGVSEIVLAYPVIGPNVDRLIAITKAYPNAKIYAIGDDTKMIKILADAAAAAGITVPILMDMDMGQHRTGVPLEKAKEMYLAWNQMDGIHMNGMHCYDGHRHEHDAKVRETEVKKVDVILEQLKADLIADGADCSVLIMGGTPSFPAHTAFTGEYLSPGTCVIQDAGYRDAYQDMIFTPAAVVLTRVISRPTEDTFTLDMGNKAVATDPVPERGELVGMEYAKTVLQNEEHWVVKVPQEHIKDIPEIGTVMFAIPVHVCPTSALYPSVPIVIDGKLAGEWEVTARNRRITY